MFDFSQLYLNNQLKTIQLYSKHELNLVLSLCQFRMHSLLLNENNPDEEKNTHLFLLF